MRSNLLSTTSTRIKFLSCITASNARIYNHSEQNTATNAKDAFPNMITIVFGLVKLINIISRRMRWRIESSTLLAFPFLLDPSQFRRIHHCNASLIINEIVILSDGQLH
jgi:hypothetical protein